MYDFLKIYEIFILAKFLIVLQTLVAARKCRSNEDKFQKMQEKYGVKKHTLMLTRPSWHYLDALMT